MRIILLALLSIAPCLPSEALVNDAILSENKEENAAFVYRAHRLSTVRH